MWFNLTKSDKPAYLRYKRGKISEHERTERVQLNQPLGEDEPDEVFDLSHPPDVTTKKRLTQGFTLLALLLFVLVFVQMVGSYTVGLFGEKTGDAVLDLTTISLPFSDKDDTTVALEVTVPDVDLPDVTLPEITVPEVTVPSFERTLPSLTVEMASPLAGETAAGTQTETETSLFALSVSIHEELHASTQRLRDTVARYADQKTDRLGVRSRVNKEKLTYASLRNQIDQATFDDQLDQAYVDSVIVALHVRLDAIERDADAILAADRSAIVSATNAFIENENIRRQDFLLLLKAGLNTYAIPFTEDNGSLNF